MALVIPPVPNVVRAPTKTFVFDGTAGKGAVGVSNDIWTPGSVNDRFSGVSLCAYVSVPLVSVLGTLDLASTAERALGTQLISATPAAVLAAIGWWQNISGPLGEPDMTGDIIARTYRTYAAFRSPWNMEALVAPFTAGEIVFDCHYIPLTPGATLT